MFWRLNCEVLLLFLILSHMKTHYCRVLHLSWPEPLELGFHRAYRGTGETRDNNNKYGLVFLGCDYKVHFTVEYSGDTKQTQLFEETCIQNWIKSLLFPNVLEI